MIAYKHRRDVKKTRKAQTCEACEQSIAKGKPATFFMGEAEGAPYNAYYHPDCRAAEEAWNAANETAELDNYLQLWSLFENRHAADFFDTEAAEVFPLRLDSEWPAVAARLRGREIDRNTTGCPA